MKSITIRPATLEDARGILEAHYSAVHETAAGDYPHEVLEAWSPAVDAARLEIYLREAFPQETTIIAESDGCIAGFGAVIPKQNELRAVYVHAAYGGKGVGDALLHALEKLAVQAGCAELAMDSSLTARRFYLKRGFKITQIGSHALRDGVKMPCLRMRKRLVTEPVCDLAEQTKVKRVTCAIIRQEGKVLLARRLPDDAQGGLWEFPGGKVDPGETEEQCLLRELDEELGIGVQVDSCFSRHRFPIRSGVLELVAFLCTMTSPPTKLEAHSEVVWVNPGEVMDWDLMPADMGIGEKLLRSGLDSGSMT